MISLDGRVAVVTGGASGIGREVCLVFAELGARIVVVDLREEPADQGVGTLEALKSAGQPGSFVTCDVTNGELVASTMAQIDHEHGGIDVLVNSAGVLFEGDALSTSDDDWRRVLSVNLDGTFFASREAVRLMVSGDRRGKIVNIASISGMRGHVEATAYGASKGGVLSLTRHMALDFARRGINVNAVVPGYVDTVMTAHYPPEERKRLEDSVPAGRWATPREIAAAAAYLASPLSDFVCGQAIVVDGGWLIGNPRDPTR